MSVVLALTDLRGVPFTGVRAALSGGNPGHTVQVYARQPGLTGAGTPTGAEVTADGSGAGAVDVPLAAAGVWGLFAVGPTTDGPFWGMASAAGDDVLNLFIDACAVVLLKCNLPDVGEKVFADRMMETVDVPGFPCVQLGLISMAGMPLAETYVGSTSGSDDWGLPVRITVADRQLPNSPGQRRRYVNWRGAIRNALVNLRPPGAPVTWKTVLEPQFVALPVPGAAQDLYLTSVMVARGVTRVVRSH